DADILRRSSFLEWSTSAFHLLLCQCRFQVCNSAAHSVQSHRSKPLHTPRFVRWTMTAPASKNDPFATTPELPQASNDSSATANVPAIPTPPVTPVVHTRIRCPYCNNPIDLADDRSDEVLCPVCGSNFHIRDTRLSSTTSGMRQLGKFQLLERVGVGGFGAVWKARDTELDRLVALKLPHAGILESDTDRQRFFREARAAAQLRHPNIVNVFE